MKGKMAVTGIMTQVFLIFFALIGLFLGFSGASAATLELPRTGQTSCYDSTGATVTCSGTGQDGEYQLGVAWPNPRFTPVPGFETDCITDNLTGLVWATSSDITQTAWQGALDYANNLVRCGEDDWRLPNINEMLSLIHTGEITTSAWLNAQGFSGFVPSLYWTSSTREVNVSSAWMVSLWNGNPPPGVKTVSGSHYALPVRGSTSGSTPVWKTNRTMCYDETGTVRNCAGTGEDGEYQEGVAWPIPRFAIGSGSEVDCITDQLTDLMWLRTPNIITTVTWQDALAAANNLSACGHSDWRLPNWNEFRSLTNYSQSNLSEWLKNPAQGFTGVTGGYYWSSTTKLATTSQPVASQAWVFSATTSAEEGFAKSDTGVPHGAWAVRGPASVTPLPNIIVDPTVINFGYVIVNNPSVARTVTIRNGGTVNLEVNSTTTTSGLFTVATGGANPCTDTTPTLAPGQSCTLVVTFIPTALGTQSATLNIASNDPDTAIVQVSLTGTGTEIAPGIVVERTGTGSGTVTGTGISCGADCTEIYNFGTSVILTATANMGSSFTSWTGCDAVNGNVCTVNMTASKSVTAAFSLNQHTLTVERTGTGSGAVTGTGISCGADCTEIYNYGTVVVLIATAATGSGFISWTGCDAINGNACSVTMNTSKSVSAAFILNQHTLAVERTGTGSGTVTGTGISCGADCTEIYNYGTSVNLTATAANGSIFAGWSGCDSVVNDVCNILINGDRDVMATFYLEYTLVVGIEGTGDGRVTSTPPDIDCEPTCSDTFVAGTNIRLTARTYAGSAFAYWSGGCSGTIDACDLTMTGYIEVNAHFVSDETKEYKLSVGKKKINKGDGLVQSDDGTISCGDVCTELYYPNAPITLRATPSPGSLFEGWTPTSLNCGTSPTCSFTMNGNAKVKAIFRGPYRLLTKIKSKNNGSGSVTADISGIGTGINCPSSSCEDYYPYGNNVVLTAQNDGSSRFTGWKPASLGCGTNLSCTVPMTKKRSVTATFEGM